jgi:putative transposase
MTISTPQIKIPEQVKIDPTKNISVVETQEEEEIPVGYRTETIHFNSPVMVDLCLKSALLYNKANQIVSDEFLKETEETTIYDELIDELIVKLKQSVEYNNLSKKEKKVFFTEYLKEHDIQKPQRRWIRYVDLWKLMKNTDEYKALPAQSAQEVLKLLDKNWKSFFAAMRKWNKAPELFTGKPKLPRFKKRNEPNIITFTNQQCRVVNGELLFPKSLNFKLKVRPNYEYKIKQVRIIPNQMKYKCEVVYEISIEKPIDYNQRIMAIDLGVRNIVTIVNNFGIQPVIIKGGILKSINHYYNVTRLNYQKYNTANNIPYGEMDGRFAKIKYDGLNKVSDEFHKTRRLAKLDFDRENKIRDIFHKITRWIAEYVKENNVDTIVIGKLPKDDLPIIHLPFDHFVGMIEYKTKERGVNVIITSEKYTSICSFLDQEEVKFHETYKGKRINRGLFQSSDGTITNADVNAAYNMLGKEFPNAFANGIKDVGLHPRKIEVEEFIPKQNDKKPLTQGEEYR